MGLYAKCLARDAKRLKDCVLLDRRRPVRKDDGHVYFPVLSGGGGCQVPSGDSSCQVPSGNGGCQTASIQLVYLASDPDDHSIVASRTRSFEHERYGQCVLLKAALEDDAAYGDIIRQCPGCQWILLKREIGGAAIRPPQTCVLCRAPGVGEHAEPLASCRQNGILYHWYPLRSMFCRGNTLEKLRLAHMLTGQRSRHSGSRDEEVVLDLYAGIGYWSIIFLKHGTTRRLFACDLNEWSLKALETNVEHNAKGWKCLRLASDDSFAKVDGKVVYLLCGDNAVFEPVYSAKCDRVVLGLLPDGIQGLPLAIRALNWDGGTQTKTLHLHRLVSLRGQPKGKALECCHRDVISACRDLLAGLPIGVNVDVVHSSRVKSYAPKIDHYVFDVQLARSVPNKVV